MILTDKKVQPIHDSVLVHNMHFGEQTSYGGLIILGDDGKDRGIYPRWGQVYAKGPENTDEFNVGDWILVEHGRWTRGVDIGPTENNKTTVRMVDSSAIIAWSTEKPNDVYIAETLSVPSANEAYRI